MVAMDNYDIRIMSNQVHFDVENSIQFFKRLFMEKNQDIPKIIDIRPTKSKRGICLKTEEGGAYIIDEYSVSDYYNDFDIAVNEY